ADLVPGTRDGGRDPGGIGEKDGPRVAGGDEGDRPQVVDRDRGRRLRGGEVRIPKTHDLSACGDTEGTVAEGRFGRERHHARIVEDGSPEAEERPASGRGAAVRRNRRACGARETPERNRLPIRVD